MQHRPVRAEADAIEWVGSAHNYVLAGVGVAATGSVVIIEWLQESLLTAIPIALIGLFASLSFMSVEVAASRQGVTASVGPWKWRIRRVDISQIRGARSLRVPASIFRGWGYRIYGRRRRAIFIRSGETLVLDLEGDRELMITVDGADEGARALNYLLKGTSRNNG